MNISKYVWYLLPKYVLFCWTRTIALKRVAIFLLLIYMPIDAIFEMWNYSAWSEISDCSTYTWLCIDFTEYKE